MFAHIVLCESVQRKCFIVFRVFAWTFLGRVTHLWITHSQLGIYGQNWVKQTESKMNKNGIGKYRLLWWPFCLGLFGILMSWNIQDEHPLPSSMMTSSNGNTSRVTGPLCREFTGESHTKASDAELWCFLWSAPETTLEQTMETPVIWDAIVLIMTSL